MVSNSSLVATSTTTRTAYTGISLADGFHGPDGGRQDVPVLGVVRHSVDQRLVAGDECVGE
jgi:hypothetical protein